MLFRRIFDMRMTFLAVLDRHGEVVEINQAPERIGLARQDFLGRHIGATPSFSADPEWIRTWDARLAEAAAAGETVSYEDVFTGPGGAMRSADATLTPVFATDGAVDYFLLEADDTTDRVQVEFELRESERRFHDMTEALPVLCWSTDAGGGCDYLNGRWIEYTGAAPGQHHGWAWIDAVHPDDRPALGEALGTAMPRATPIQFEGRLRDRDGDHRWFDIRMVPVLGAAGEVTRWYGSAADIHDAHELRRSLAEREAQLSAALQAGSMARFSYDLESRRLHFDPSLRELIPNLSDMVERDGLEGFAEHVHPEDRVRWQGDMLRAFDPATPEFSVAYRVLGGRPDWLGTRGRVAFDDAGRPRSIAAVVFVLPGGPVRPVAASDGDDGRVAAPSRIDPRD